jgi:hypothetical protein
MLPLSLSRVLALLLAFVLLADRVQASDVYLDPVLGSDLTGDGSAAQPWRSLTHAVTALPPGVPTIHFAAGTYDTSTGEVFPLNIPAVDGLTLRGAGSTLTTLVNANQAPALNFDSSSAPPANGYTFNVEDLAFDGSAIRSEGSFTGAAVVVKNTKFLGGSRGVETGESGSIVASNCSFESYTRAATAGEFGEISLSDCIIRGGTIGVSCIAGPSVDANVLLTRTVIRDCEVAIDADSTFSFGGFPQASVRLRDSLVFANGIAVRGSGIATVYLTSSTVTANQIGIQAFDTFPGSVFVILDGSILWNNTSEGDLGSIFSANHSNLPVGSFGINCLSVDPRFIDPLNADFHLKSDSPLIDQGGTSLPNGFPLFEADFDPRLLDGDGDGIAQRDMGFDEWNPAHLDVSGTPSIGQFVTITTTGPIGSTYLLGLATSTGETPAMPFGAVLINLATFAVVTQWFTPSVDVVPVPLAPVLIGLDVHLQAFVKHGTSGFLTNRVDLTIQP